MRAAHQLGAAEVVDARVAGVDESQSRVGLIRNAAIVLCGSSSEVIAVSLIIRCASSTSCLSASAGVVAARRVALEQLLRGQQHLVGGLAAAALAAHAVGQHAHARSRARARAE